MARVLAVVAMFALLAGCASPDATPRADAAPSTGPLQDAPAPAAPLGQQSETLSWLVSGIACGHSSATQEAVYASLRPELEGVTYDAAAVAPESFGRAWSLTVQPSPSLVGFEVTFWEGAVGSGQPLTLQVILPPLDRTTTAAGAVPDGADFVSVFACSAEPASADYVAELVPAALLAL